MPTRPFDSGVFLDQPVDGVPGVGGVIGGRRVQGPRTGRVIR